MLKAENLRSVSNSPVYEENKLLLGVSTCTKLTSVFKFVSLKYHWFIHYFDSGVVDIVKFDLDHRNLEIFAKELQGRKFFQMGRTFVGVKSCYF